MNANHAHSSTVDTTNYEKYTIEYADGKIKIYKSSDNTKALVTDANVAASTILAIVGYEDVIPGSTLTATLGSTGNDEGKLVLTYKHHSDEGVTWTFSY